MLNFAWSAPPVIENVTLWAGRSASVAVTVVTAVVFSATLGVALDVKTGLLSLTGVTVTVKVCLVVDPPPPLAQVQMKLTEPVSPPSGVSLLGSALMVACPQLGLEKF